MLQHGVVSSIKRVLARISIKEKLSKLIVFKKRGNNVKIEEHMRHVKEFIEQFTRHSLVTDEEKVKVFLKYFDEEILNEIECMSDDNSIRTLDWYEERIIKVVEVKRSKTSVIMNILEDVRQERDETVLEFAKRVRMRCLTYEGEKEKMMLCAFIEGVRNQTLSSALKIRDPKTLEEVVEEIKTECGGVKKREDEYNQVRKMTTADQGTMNSLKREIDRLNKVTEELRRERGRNTKQTSYQQRQTRDIVCFKCNEKGHMARFCQKKEDKETRDMRTCYKCGKAGHIAVNCRVRIERASAVKCYECGGGHLARYCDKGNKFRYFQEEETDEESSTNRSTAESDGEKHVNNITEIKLTKEKVPKDLSLEQKYVNYINGHGKKPRKQMVKYQPTVISTSRPEKARNKPITEC